MNRYIVGTLALIGLAILLIVLLTTGGSAPKKAIHTPTLLYDYANTNAVVKIVDDGPIVAPEDRSSAEVDVSQYNASFYLYQGYNGSVVRSKILNNSETSFRSFLYALYYAGFSNSRPSTFTSDIGLCASGDRYDIYLQNNGQTIEHLWTTSCASDPSTFAGNFNQVLTLFSKQIPNINSLTTGANL